MYARISHHDDFNAELYVNNKNKEFISKISILVGFIYFLGMTLHSCTFSLQFNQSTFGSCAIKESVML